MLNSLKNVAKFFFYIIGRIFVTINSTIDKQLHIKQQIIAIDDTKLHYIKKKKVVTPKGKNFVTGVLAPSVIIYV